MSSDRLPTDYGPPRGWIAAIWFAVVVLLGCFLLIGFIAVSVIPKFEKAISDFKAIQDREQTRGVELEEARRRQIVQEAEIMFHQIENIKLAKELRETLKEIRK